MTTRVHIQFIHDATSQMFHREMDWAGPVPSVGDVIAWELDPADPVTLPASKWTVTSAEFQTRLEVNAAPFTSAVVPRVNLIAHLGAKSPT